jgi:hypothetical protein
MLSKEEREFKKISNVVATSKSKLITIEALNRIEGSFGISIEGEGVLLRTFMHST